MSVSVADKNTKSVQKWMVFVNHYGFATLERGTGFLKGDRV